MKQGISVQEFTTSLHPYPIGFLFLWKGLSFNMPPLFPVFSCDAEVAVQAAPLLWTGTEKKKNNVITE